jgi:hypothetical protein
MIKYTVIALALLSSTSAHACDVIGQTATGEELCATTSDGTRGGYTNAQPQQSWRQRHWEADMRAREDAGSRWRQQNWMRHQQGTTIGGVFVSPYPAGSQQDIAWRRSRGCAPTGPC